MSQSRESKSSKAEIILARFAALRGEIDNRSNAQLALISLNMTAVGTLGGFALTDPSRFNLLILFPILCSSLGLLWLDHHNTIQNIGIHIGQLHIDGLPVSPWEDVVRAQEKKTRFRLPFLTQILIIFGGAPLYSLIRLPTEIVGGWLWLLYGVGALLFLLFFWYWLYCFQYKDVHLEESK